MERHQLGTDVLMEVHHDPVVLVAFPMATGSRNGGGVPLGPPQGHGATSGRSGEGDGDNPGWAPPRPHPPITPWPCVTSVSSCDPRVPCVLPCPPQLWRQGKGDFFLGCLLMAELSTPFVCLGKVLILVSMATEGHHRVPTPRATNPGVTRKTPWVAGGPPNPLGPQTDREVSVGPSSPGWMRGGRGSLKPWGDAGWP